VKNVRKTWLRRRGDKALNVTTGRYRIVCDECGYTSIESYVIELAEQERIAHVSDTEHRKVFLEEIIDESGTIATEIANKKQDYEVSDWMYDCLNEAKDIINNYHHEDCGQFLSKCTFNLFIQTDKEYAYSYISLDSYPHFRIGIHEVLAKDTPDNRRMVRVVLVHELLHAIHPNWSEERVWRGEELLMNKAGHFDALRNLEILYLSGNMRLCDR
jgi:hypothetical protein